MHDPFSLKKIYRSQSFNHLLLVQLFNWSWSKNILILLSISIMRPGPESVHLEIFLQVSYQYYSVHIYLGILSGTKEDDHPKWFLRSKKCRISRKVWNQDKFA